MRARRQIACALNAKSKMGLTSGGHVGNGNAVMMRRCINRMAYSARVISIRRAPKACRVFLRALPLTIRGRMSRVSVKKCRRDSEARAWRSHAATVKADRPILAAPGAARPIACRISSNVCLLIVGETRRHA
jgi:hypothetical protein